MAILRHPATRRFASIFALCMLVAFAFTVVTESAHAAGSTVGGDKSLAEKKGLGGAFKKKEVDEDRMPEKWQMWLGVGSIPAMIIVVKYL